MREITSVYLIDPNMPLDKKLRETERVLLSVVTCINILYKQNDGKLTGQSRCFLQILQHAAQQLFLLYGAVYSLQSVEAKMFSENQLPFIINPALDDYRRLDSLRSMIYQLVTLCEGALDYALVDVLDEQAMNILVNTSSQTQILRQSIENLENCTWINTAISN